MDKGRLEKLHVLCFHNRYRKELKFGYARADPNFDAWMCVLGKQREQFNAKTLEKKHPSVLKKIEELRKFLKVDLSTINVNEKARLVSVIFLVFKYCI